MADHTPPIAGLGAPPAIAPAMEAVDQGGTRSGGKRRPSPTAGDGKRKKRRFVWGDDLHAAFQTAIFDVGLRAATVHALSLIHISEPTRPY